MSNLAASNLSLNAVESEEDDVSDNTTAPSSVSASTHDTSRSSYHITELSIFAERLEQVRENFKKMVSLVCKESAKMDCRAGNYEYRNLMNSCAQSAAARAFPNRGRSRYSDVIAVLIYWEEDDLNVQNEVEKLYDVFNDCYNFKTEVFKIPSKSAHRQLMGMVVDFVERYDSSENLMVVYYGGHGLINSARQSTWLCNRKPSSPTVKWSAIQSVFEECASDVLFLLDCCAAAGAAPDSGQGVIETIAACGFETWAPGPGRHSFTNALLEVLDDWMDKPSFSAAMLHSEILSVIKHDRPERKRWTDANKVESRKTPIYILTSNDPKSKSIELSVRPLPEVQGSAGTSTGKPRKPTIPKASTLSRQDIFNLSQINRNLPSGKLTVPHVLLSVALEEDQSLDLDSWARWIGDNPALAKYVLVEGIFRSHSTMILLSLPVPLWDVLQDDLAISFIAYVESRNALLLANEETNSRIQELDALLSTAQLRAEKLELLDSTWQQRIEKERRHAGIHYQALQERFLKEVDARKATEARLDELKTPGRRGTKTQQMKPAWSYGIQKQDPPARPKSPSRVPSATLPRVPLRPRRIPLPIRPSTPLSPAGATSDRPRNDARDGHSTVTSTIESADSGWSNAGDLPHRNAEYDSKSDYSDYCEISPSNSPLQLPEYESGTGVLKEKHGSWAQVVGKGAQN